MKKSRRLVACAGTFLGGIVLFVAVPILVFGHALVNGYGKTRLERAFATAYPGYAVRIGELGYAVGADRLVAQSVTLSASNTTLKVGRISLTGARWAQLLWGTGALADILAKASLEATKLEAEFPQARYGVRCARLRALVPGSELIAERTELRPLVGDEAFFAAHTFRATRFQVVVPECRVLGLAYRELLQGKSYRARSAHFSRPTFDALVNCDKPVAAFVKSPLMLHEALAAIRQPFQIESLSITNGHLTYGERVVAGAEPGVLTFSAVNLLVAGMANRSAATGAIQLQGQGELMNAGTLRVLMTIPATSPDFSLHYSGSLAAMDLTRLDAFLEIAQHTRIKSGTVKEATFDIEVTAGRARGHVSGIYKDLEIAFLNKHTDSEKGLANRVASFLANVSKIRNANAPDASGAMKEGVVNYSRRPDEQFQEFAWFALRSGVLDVISH